MSQAGDESLWTLRPIGVLHTPFQEVAGTPIQPSAAAGVRGEVEVFAEFAEGLADLGGFSHLILLYRFHRCSDTRLRVVPFMDTQERGVFATRAPVRPNHIGLSTVRLLGVRGNRLDIEGVDMLDGTPLLDIKPFFPRHDNHPDARGGWLEERGAVPENVMRADDRFA